MRHRSLQWIGTAGVIALVSVTMARVNGRAQTRTPELTPVPAQNAGPAPQTIAAAKTPWGEPDLQGIWSVELMVPLERPAEVTTEFYTEEEVAGLDDLRRGTSVFGNHLRAEPGSEADVAGAYNAVFTSQRPTGRRTGMIVDPPDGKLPPLTPEVQQRQAVMRDYLQALFQNTVGCRDNPSPAAAGRTGHRHQGERSRRRSIWQAPS